MFCACTEVYMHKTSQNAGKTKSCPYKELGVSLDMQGLPAGIRFSKDRKPSSFGVDKLKSIYACKDNIEFVSL